MKWVKHDTDANMDAKLQEVLLDYGLEGYGLYWYCVELIAGKIDVNNITFSLEHDCRVIARNTGSTPTKVSEMMTRFVSLGLFEDSEGIITCLKIARRLDSSMTSNPEMRKILQSMRKSHDLLPESHDRVMTESAKPMQDKIRLDKNNTIGEKSPKTPSKKFIPPTVEEVQNYISEKNFNIDAQKFVDYYSATNWFRGKTKIKDWKACVRTWVKNYKSSIIDDGIGHFT